MLTDSRIVLLTALLLGGSALAQEKTTSPETTQSATQSVVVTPLNAAQENMLKEAYSLHKANKLPQARQLFETLIAQNYNHPEAHIGLALTLIAQQDDKGAAFELERFNALAPDRYEGVYNLGIIASRAGNHEEALKYYGEAATRAKDKAPSAVMAQILRALADEQTHHADFNGLTETLEQLLVIEPSNDTQFRLAQAKTLAGDGVQALPHLYDLRQKDTQRADVTGLIADIYVSQKLYDRANREIISALNMIKDPKNRSMLLLQKANISLLQGDKKAAVYSAQAARLADPSNTDAWIKESNLWIDLGNKAEALKSYRAAYTAAPREAKTLQELAELSLNLQQYDDAYNYANQLRSLNKDKAVIARAQYLQGVARYGAGKLESAAQLLKESALSAPSAETSAWLGLTYYELGRYEEAVMALTQSATERPVDLTLQNLGSALLAAQRHEEALHVSQQLVTQNPRNAHGWYLLGLAQRSLGQAEIARKSLQTAVSLGHPEAGKIK